MQLLVFSLKPMTAKKKAQGLIGEEYEKARMCLQGQNHEGFQVQDSTTMKVILVGDEGQFDLKPFQTLQAQYDIVEWDYAPFDQHHNPEPYIEIRLKQDVPFLQPHSTSQSVIAFDVKGSEKLTQGDCPVSLCQVGSFGSCLSALRSRRACAMEGEFNTKGAVKMGAVKSFQGGSHINRQVPETFAQCPLPLETFLHIQTWHAKYPSSSQNYALEFNVGYAGNSGIAFNLTTFTPHRWNPSIDWSSAIAQTDLFAMYDLKYTLKRIL